MSKVDQDYARLIKTIDSAISGFDGSIPAIQKQIYSQLLVFLKDIELSNGRVLNSVNNNRMLGKLKAKIESIVISEGYKKSIIDFTKTFALITQWHDNYFSSITAKFKPRPVLEAIKKNAIDWTIEGLSERTPSAVSYGIREILNRNITTGGKFADLMDQMRVYLSTTEAGNGALQRYTQQITTDSLNQYSRQYNQAVSADLGLKWRRYVGSNIATTREFCDHLTGKEFYHISELPEILKGHIDGHQVKINPKTDLWYGAITGTNTANFSINAGGHNCGHQDLGVSDAMVPEHLRDKFK